MNPYILVLFCVASLASGQIMFKIVSSRATSYGAFIGDIVAIAVLFVALALYAVSTVAWIFALRSLPLSQAYLFMSLGFVAVPIASHFLFGEQLSVFQLVGTALIVAGLVVATR